MFGIQITDLFGQLTLCCISTVALLTDIRLFRFIIFPSNASIEYFISRTKFKRRGGNGGGRI